MTLPRIVVNFSVALGVVSTNFVRYDICGVFMRSRRQ
jgi:hypothetical protein